MSILVWQTARERKRARYARLVALGLCVQCGLPNATHTDRCEDCLFRLKLASIERAARREAVRERYTRRSA